MENTIYEYFRKIVHYQRNMQREYLEKFGLYYGQPRVLKTILENDSITQSELVEKLNVSKESVSTSLKRLSQNHLVNKTRDESDKRIIRLSLSEKGKQITEDSFAGINQLNQELFASLDEEEKKVLTSAFKKIVESIEGGNQ